MTAVDVDALDKLREAWAAGGWPAVDAMFAVQRALPDLLAEVRRGRALREAAADLARKWLREGSAPTQAIELRAVLAAVDGGEQ